LVRTIFPDIKWAQRKDRVFITVDVPDCKNHKIDITPEGLLKFSGESSTNNYGFELQLFGDVIVDECKWNTKGRNIFLSIMKKELEGDEQFWARFTKEKLKHPHIHVDWDKWADEDDDEEDVKEVGKEWDPSMMQGMGGGAPGGMPGMPGMPGMGGLGGMPGLGGMGGGMPGMPGMGGMGGMPGMGGMGGGMPGMEGMGGMDMQQMMAQMQGMGGMGGMGGGMPGMEGGDSDDDEEEKETNDPKGPNADLGDLDAPAESS
jgi:hypothetical protein